jgi:calcium-dependent protein kinase
MGGTCCTNRENMTINARRGSNTPSKRGSILLEKYSKITDYKKKYEYISILGNGGFGKVRLHRDRNCKEMRFAIKTLKKDFLNTHNIGSLIDEVTILRELDHPNIVKYFETYEDDFYLHIVMEYIPGENLFKVITNRKYNRFRERDAAEILTCLFKAVLFLHKNNIIHRDIKPENILFSMPGKYQSLKLIDFGLSTANNKRDKYRVGSPYYMAPEMIEGQFSFATDTWSIGVILYVMMTGVQPFKGKDQSEVFAKISQGIYDTNLLDRQKCSSEVKDLIKKLLVKDHRRRLTIETALEHPWITTHKDYNTTSAIDEGIIDSLRSFVNNDPFQKEIMYYFAKISNEKEILKLKQTFLDIDKDNTGTIEYEEIFQIFETLGIKPDAVRNIIYYNNIREK